MLYIAGHLPLYDAAKKGELVIESLTSLQLLIFSPTTRRSCAHPRVQFKRQDVFIEKIRIPEFFSNANDF